MSKKIFYAIMSVSMTILLASLLIVSSFLYDYYNDKQLELLGEELALVKAGVDGDGESYLERLSSARFRLTLVSQDGKVIYDSSIDASQMENHLDREEIREAIATGHGSSARYSSTLTERTLYEAVMLENGTILRIATTQATIGALLVGISPAICAMILFALITSMLLSQRMAKSIVKPLEKLDLEHPECNDTYEELAPVLLKLKGQHKQIERQIAQLCKNAEEFKQVTASMREGLVLLDKNACILSINPAAQTLFGANDSIIGCDLLTLDRTREMRDGVKTALEGTHSEFEKMMDCGEYRFMITPTLANGEICGVVILCIDITEAALAERSRREFTANVSHELKTPLQGIIGSADLLESGLAKPEDTGRFIDNIKKEAERLLSLINDIIRLSRLDENADIPLEPTDPYALALEVVSALTPEAQKRNVSIRALGSSFTLYGSKSYIYELIYNLCDNAIRYNVSGGNVQLELSHDNDKATIRVSDTGIGIPTEHQARIFERFYRVDKSHSKQTGGTGLGLSIVKHIVMFHHGSIKLDSTPEHGTIITVTLPLDQHTK